jgi:hypothetical protein
MSASAAPQESHLQRVPLLIRIDCAWLSNSAARAKITQALTA